MTLTDYLNKIDWKGKISNFVCGGLILGVLYTVGKRNLDYNLIETKETNPIESVKKDKYIPHAFLAPGKFDDEFKLSGFERKVEIDEEHNEDVFIMIPSHGWDENVSLGGDFGIIKNYEERLTIEDKLKEK